MDRPVPEEPESTDSSPAAIVCQHVGENGGEATARGHHLMTSWGLDVWGPTERDLVERDLASVGIRSQPSLSEVGPDDEIVLTASNQVPGSVEEDDYVPESRHAAIGGVSSALSDAPTGASDPERPHQGGYCPRCGAPVNEGDRFCRGCGNNLEASTTPDPGPSSGASEPGTSDEVSEGARIVALNSVLERAPHASGSGGKSGFLKRTRRRLSGQRRRTKLAAGAGILVFLGAVAGGAFLLVDDDSTNKRAKSSTPASNPAPPEPEGTGETQTNATWSLVWNSGAAGNKGDPVKVAGRVYQETGGTLLMYADPSADELPTQVEGYYSGISEDDYVLVEGTIRGSDSYETVAGGEVDVVQVDADEVTKISQARADALANPATDGRRSLRLGQSQGGFTVNLRSIAWTEDSTRLNVTVTNNSGAKGSLFTSDAKVQQGTKQFGLKDDLATNPLDEDILSGATVRGSLSFDKIDQARGKAYVELDWTSDNYDLDAKPFAFNLAWTP